MDTASIITSADFLSVIEALQNQISVATLVEVLVVAAAACVGMVFMWWGVRKISQVIMSAFRNGTVSL